MAKRMQKIRREAPPAAKTDGRFEVQLTLSDGSEFSTLIEADSQADAERIARDRYAAHLPERETTDADTEPETGGDAA